MEVEIETKLDRLSEDKDYYMKVFDVNGNEVLARLLSSAELMGLSARQFRFAILNHAYELAQCPDGQIVVVDMLRTKQEDRALALSQ